MGLLQWMSDWLFQKEESLNRTAQTVRDAWVTQHQSIDIAPIAANGDYVVDVLDDSTCIVNTGGALYKIPYTKGEGGIAFGEPVEVELRYVEKESKDLKPGFEETENQIRYRVRNPDGFAEGSFRTVAMQGAKGLSTVMGKLQGEDTMTIQALRFDKAEWTMEQAKKWVTDHPNIKKDAEKGVSEAAVKRMISSMASNMGVTVSTDDMATMMTDLADMMDGSAPDMMAAIAKKLRTLQEPSKGTLKFRKQADGRIRFLGVASNHFRDDDSPPEILASTAHKDFVARVEAGGIPYPILCLWHEKALRFGQADLADFTDEGMLVLSGLVDEGKEDIVQGLESLPEEFQPLGMSHEFVPLEKDNENVVTLKYDMSEGSVLPQAYAANRWTSAGFTPEQKEVDMPMSEPKRAFLTAVLGEEGVSEFEATLKGTADAAISSGAQWKEAPPDGSLVVLERPDGSLVLGSVEPEPEYEDNSESGDEPPDEKAEEVPQVTVADLAELASGVAALANAFEAFQEELPAVIEAAVKARFEDLPRATIYRASADPRNRTRKATATKEAPADEEDVPVDRNAFWEDMQHGAVGSKGAGAGARLGG